MERILFVCLGNICRSTMAEYVMRHLLDQSGLSDQVLVASAGTGAQTGSPVHSGTRRKLAQVGIPCGNHRGTQMRRSDYGHYDLLIGMDEENRQDMLRILAGKGGWGWGSLTRRDAERADPEGKVRLLLDWTDHPRDIADPWYTRDFDAAYRDVRAGCEALVSWLVRSGRVS